MAANSATGHLMPWAAKSTPQPDRPSEPAEALTPPLWRVVDRDGSTCDLPLAAGPQASREDTTAERREGDTIGQDGAPDKPWSEPKASLSDLGLEEAALKSRQWVAAFSPQSAKPEARIPRSEAAPRLPEHGESIGQSALPDPPESAGDLSESPAPMVLKPGALDPDLCQLIGRWLVLPPRVREAIFALIDAAAPR